MDAWIQQFDVEAPAEPRAVEFLREARVGDRDNCRWARLTPPLLPGDAANPETLETVLLVPRQAGSLIEEPLAEAVHVHVCSGDRDDAALPTNPDPDQIKIRHWAVLTPP